MAYTTQNIEIARFMGYYYQKHTTYGNWGQAPDEKPFKLRAGWYNAENGEPERFDKLPDYTQWENLMKVWIRICQLPNANTLVGRRPYRVRLQVARTNQSEAQIIINYDSMSQAVGKVFEVSLTNDYSEVVGGFAPIGSYRQMMYQLVAKFCKWYLKHCKEHPHCN